MDCRRKGSRPCQWFASTADEGDVVLNPYGGRYGESIVCGVLEGSVAGDCAYAEEAGVRVEGC